ncbi:MAG: class A beta-lactamase [Acidobacteriota bacterium]|nr:MAG: class A beta-lactamase [Acidobacteriota bacterium]
MHLKLRILPLFVSLIACGIFASAQQADPALQRLEREIARLGQTSGGVTGASIIHLETGRRISLNGDHRFPMASSYKVPIAVQLLTLVDDGKIRLDQMIEIRPSDLHPGSGTLTNLFKQPGVALSVRNLMELMLLISDNSATDVCLRLAGGAGAVTARMNQLGISGITVSRPTIGLISDWLGVSEADWSSTEFKYKRSLDAEGRKSAAARFDSDPRDTSTPDAMTALLEKIYRKSLLKPESAELLYDIMRRCQTGDARLKGILPAGTEVAHKTGTIGGTTNDVGIITLPDNAGHVAISVFIRSSEKEVPQRERTIAEIARAAHDFFLFNPAGK